MGNTFSRFAALGTAVHARGRTCAHFVANPIFLAFRGLRRSVHKFLFRIGDLTAESAKCYPCLCSKCYQRLRPLPSPALSSKGGEGEPPRTWMSSIKLNGSAPRPSPRSSLAERGEESGGRVCEVRGVIDVTH